MYFLYYFQQILVNTQVFEKMAKLKKKKNNFINNDPSISEPTAVKWCHCRYLLQSGV